MARNDYNSTYDVRDVMAASVMAYRINGDEYCAFTVGDDVWTGRESTEYRIVKQANKHLMQYSMTDMQVPVTISYPKANYYFDIEADEEDYAVADEMISYYSGLMLKAISGKINEFEERVLGLIKSGTVSVKDFGIIASLPKSYFRSLERDEVEEKQRQLSDTSEFIGQIGHTVDLIIRVLRCNYIQKLSCYVVNAVHNGNLVVFFTSTGEFENIDSVRVRARVKRHQTSSYHGGKETVLNYVKKMA